MLLEKQPCICFSEEGGHFSQPTMEHLSLQFIGNIQINPSVDTYISVLFAQNTLPP